jgi:hypothetical protein
VLPGGEASEDVTVFVRERGVFHAVYDRWPAVTVCARLQRSSPTAGFVTPAPTAF